MHTGQIDVTPRAEFPRSNDSGADSSSPFFKDREPDHAVVHQNVVANGDIVYESVVIHIDRIRLLALSVATVSSRMSSCFNWRSVSKSPVRMAGPCVSSRTPTDRRASSASARIRGTISRTEP